MKRLEQQINRIKTFVDLHGNLSDRLAMQEIVEALSQQEAEPVAECGDCMELIDERDGWEERATALADAVGEYFGVPVGEHKSANCPISEAMKILNGEYKTPAVDKAWGRFQAAVTEPEPVASVPHNLSELLHTATIKSGTVIADSVPQDVGQFIAQNTVFAKAASSNAVKFIPAYKVEEWMAGHKRVAVPKPAFLILENINEALRNYLILCCDKPESPLYSKKLSEVAMSDFHSFVSLGGDKLFEAMLTASKEGGK